MGSELALRNRGEKEMMEDLRKKMSLRILYRWVNINNCPGSYNLYLGVDKDMYVSILDNCPGCKGSGSEPGTTPERCPSCNGKDCIF